MPNKASKSLIVNSFFYKVKNKEEEIKWYIKCRLRFYFRFYVSDVGKDFSSPPISSQHLLSFKLYFLNFYGPLSSVRTHCEGQLVTLS